MNRVGAGGQGESVWLAWFLTKTLRSFAGLADARGDQVTADMMRRKAQAYVDAVEASGWDGRWYRRAYYDDGAPLGSAADDECRIDSIAQSWSVISGAADATRQVVAMQSLNEMLVREDARLIVLLTPPFDLGVRDPGYIKGYLPGVRENGAQYTHAALWAAQATAMMGNGDRAFELLQMSNPITRSATAADMRRYRVEPYVVAADIYAAGSQLGRGGWTWYTGSASWMYRVGLENILGFTKAGDTLRMNPCVPVAWTSFEITYRFHDTTYEIAVHDPAAAREGGGSWRMTVDGKCVEEGVVRLLNDGGTHKVDIRGIRGGDPGTGTLIGDPGTGTVISGKPLTDN
jgi:cyclic beta-1,2-glucan synthetase